jgi:ribosomal protein L29
MSNQLRHFGVKGMKWGRRKKRVAVDNRQSANINRPPQQSAPKKPRRMSKKELQARVNRLKLEQELARLEAASMPAKKNRVEQLVKTAGTVAALTGSAYTIYKNLDNIVKLAKKVS